MELIAFLLQIISLFVSLTVVYAVSQCKPPNVNPDLLSWEYFLLTSWVIVQVEYMAFPK